MIKRIHNKRFKGITMKSGYVYHFKYSSWRNDPTPTIIFMYSLEGINPRTGHEWRFLQGINFTYIPRAIRKAFAQSWTDTFQRSNGNVKFTYETVKRRYPDLILGIRRYFIKPNYYISNLNEVPFENMEQAIVSTWSKDFSKKVRQALQGKFNKVMGVNRKI